MIQFGIDRTVIENFTAQTILIVDRNLACVRRCISRHGGGTFFVTDLIVISEGPFNLPVGIEDLSEQNRCAVRIGFGVCWIVTRDAPLPIVVQRTQAHVIPVVRYAPAFTKQMIRPIIVEITTGRRVRHHFVFHVDAFAISLLALSIDDIDCVD